MQTTLLPGAEKIYTATSPRSTRTSVPSVRPPTVGFALLGLVLAAIGVGSVIVFARTNRQFNVGLVVAAHS